MTVIRSILFDLVFYVSSALFAVFCLPILLGSPSFMRRSGAQWSRLVVWMFEVIVGTNWEVRGAARIPDGPVIYASKHQSAWDTVFFPYYLDEPAMVAKKELRWIPFYGWYAWRAEAIWIDRARGSKALRALIRGSRKTLREGRSIFMFPQGTRTMPGETQSYQAGVAALYSAVGVPVVPVALNSGLFWGKRSLLKRRGTIIVEFLDPIPEGLSRSQFLDELAKRTDEATRRLEEEAREQPGL
jgi:1-acyl-sn-glycerol-3-phosphate acyltransferase